MAVRLSAGLLLYRKGPQALEVLIGHMGGPFWARRDDRAWSIPKGEYFHDEPAFDAARREFREEIGHDAPGGEALELGDVRQSSGKLLTVFAVEGDLDVTEIDSMLFELEWPKGSGTMRKFPEFDRAQWFPVPEARYKLVLGQVPFVDRLVAELEAG